MFEKHEAASSYFAFRVRGSNFLKNRVKNLLSPPGIPKPSKIVQKPPSFFRFLPPTEMYDFWTFFQLFEEKKQAFLIDLKEITLSTRFFLT